MVAVDAYPISDDLRHRILTQIAPAQVAAIEGCVIALVRDLAFAVDRITGQPIALEDLKYWDVDRQEAYSTPQARLQRGRR